MLPLPAALFLGLAVPALSFAYLEHASDTGE
jgi:hypothetical protein